MFEKIRQGCQDWLELLKFFIGRGDYAFNNPNANPNEEFPLITQLERAKNEREEGAGAKIYHIHQQMHAGLGGQPLDGMTEAWRKNRERCQQGEDAWHQQSNGSGP